MEVDRVDKRKGRNTGKNKGRGSRERWAGLIDWRGRGRGRANKGKGTGKAKSKSKGKHGGNKGGAKGGKKSSGRGKLAYGQCSNFDVFGHWGSECHTLVYDLN